MLNDIRLLLRHKRTTPVDSYSPPIPIQIIKYLSNATYNCQRKNSNPTSCLVLYLYQLITFYTSEIKGAKSQQISVRISLTLHYASPLDLPHFNVKTIQHKQVENTRISYEFRKNYHHKTTKIIMPLENVTKCGMKMTQYTKK